MAEFKTQPKGFATKAIHFAQEAEQWDHLSVVTPLVMSATFKQHKPAQPKLYEYGRYNNPTRDVLEKCLASLDNGKYCLTYGSGSGTSATLIQLLNSGDHIIACDDMYTGTSVYFKDIGSRHGIETDFIDFLDLDNLKKALKPNTKLIWIESPSNPCLKVIDIAAVCKIAHSQSDVIVAVDNTFLTSYFQRPLELNADLVCYSLSKFMNGHTDIVMGAIVTSNDKLHERLRFLQRASGGIPSPFDCYQVIRSLKTLAIRMEKHSKNALIIAHYLESHPKIEKVLHPGLLTHPQHQLALHQSYGHSGVISFYIAGNADQTNTFLQNLKLVTLGASLGGIETLIESVSLMSHSPLSAEERLRLGITDNLLRISVGLEDVDDLIDDLKHALDATFSSI